MALTRRTVLATGGALALGSVAGCQTVVPGSSANEQARIRVSNKAETEKTLTLAVAEGTDKNPDEYLWKRKSSLARQGGSETAQTVHHEVPANASYMIEVRPDEDGPVSTSVIPWQDATGAFVINIFANRIETRIESDQS